MKHAKLTLGWILCYSFISWTSTQAELTPGRLDLGFDPGAGANSEILVVAVQADGKVLLGGNFTTVDGTTRNCIARLNTDGSLDTAFDPGIGAATGVYPRHANRRQGARRR